MCDVEYSVVWNVVSWYVESFYVNCGGVEL